jgi:hypothetical protein
MIRNPFVLTAVLVWGGIGCSSDTTRERADGGGKYDATVDPHDGAAGTGGGGGDSCTPTRVSEDCRAKNDARCKTLGFDACSAAGSGCLVLTAARIDSARNCAAPTQEFVGCGIFGCGALYTVVSDPDGNLWYFPSTCHPDGWTQASLSGVPTCSDDAGAPDSGKAADGGDR